MRKKHILLGIYFLCFTACSILPEASRQTNGSSVEWTNKMVDRLLLYNDTVSSYQLKPKYRKLAIPFSVKEKELHLKGETYGYAMRSIDGRYYTVAERKDKYGYNYKLIAYNVGGENDTEILVSQLNSYRQGTPIDALILEMNFVFETHCSAHYAVNDSVIKIDRYEVNGILYTEDGDIIGTKNIPDTVISRSVYKIKAGQFILLSGQ